MFCLIIFLITHYVFLLICAPDIVNITILGLGYFCTFYKYSKSIEPCSGVHLNYLARLSV